MIDTCAGCLHQESIEMHHPFNGPDRKVSEWIRKTFKIETRVPLCKRCHIRIDNDPAFRRYLQEVVQKFIMKVLRWALETWLQYFRQNYIGVPTKQEYRKALAELKGEQ